MPESKNRRRSGRQVSRGQRAAASNVPIVRPQAKKANKLYVAASAIIAVLVIGGFAVGGVNFQRPPDTGSSSGEYVDGVGVQQELMPTGARGLNGHVQPQEVDYSTSPPTSGDHWDRPATCGFYEDGLPDEQIVHNLEHSNIVVSYNLSTEEEVDQLLDALSGIGLSDVWGVTRSYDQIPVGTVALAAWGVLDTMEGVDDQRIKTFFETYAGSNIGPENFIC